MWPVRLLQTAGIMLLVFLVTVTAAVAKKVSQDSFYKPNPAEQRFSLRAEEINAEFGPRAEAEPENATLFFEWGLALNELAGQAMRSYKTGGMSYVEIKSMTVPHFARAAGLEPENPGYAHFLAQSRIDVITVMEGDLREENSSLSLARKAVEKALLLEPDNVNLIRSWALRLIHFASVPAVPAADALEYLREAEGYLEALWKESAKPNPKWILNDLGRAAVLAACRESEPERQRAALDKARGFFEQSHEHEGGLAWLHWSNALNPRDKTLTDPEFEKTLRREMLIPQRLYVDTPHAFAGYGNLCINLEAVASFTDDPAERRSLLLEGEQACEMALRDKSSIAPNVKPARKRIRAALKSYR